ncbi:MAG: regulatory protein RecX [Mariprofundaceae bacterium]
MREKLRQRDYTGATIETVIARLQADGYLSEARFAEAFLRMRLRKGESPWLAAKKARQRGADEAALQDALQMFEADFDAFSVCRELVIRRDPQGLRFEDERVWQRQARFLQNKGFGAAIILRVLNAHDLNEKLEDVR